MGEAGQTQPLSRAIRRNLEVGGEGSPAGRRSGDMDLA
jgi:hypothetical protein